MPTGFTDSINFPPYFVPTDTSLSHEDRMITKTLSFVQVPLLQRR